LAVPLAIKNLRLASRRGRARAVSMPAASLVNDRLVGMAAWGWADLDWSALGLLAVGAGLCQPELKPRQHAEASIGKRDS